MTHIFSKRQLEGYVLIDHRESPGLPVQAERSGLPIGAGQFFEGATHFCSHCEATVIKNPFRVREYAHCPHCDHFICDGCGVRLKLTGECDLMAKKVEAIMRERLRMIV